MDNSTLRGLTESIVRPDRLAEATKLVSKWEKTGLLEGLVDTPKNKARSTMARLMENQAAGNGNASGLSIAVMDSAVAGDYYTVQVYQTSGGSLNLLSSIYNHLAVVKAAPF